MLAIILLWARKSGAAISLTLARVPAQIFISAPSPIYSIPLFGKPTAPHKRRSDTWSTAAKQKSFKGCGGPIVHSFQTIFSAVDCIAQPKKNQHFIFLHTKIYRGTFSRVTSIPVWLTFFFKKTITNGPILYSNRDRSSNKNYLKSIRSIINSSSI